MMLYTIENGALRVTVNGHGAELWAVEALGDGGPTDCLWDGSGGHWPRRAPLCFPWCGRLEGDWFEHGGVRYPGGGHGFARDLEHELISRSGDSLTFRLDWSADRERWPWSFSLETRHSVSGRVLTCECSAVNTSGTPMPAQLGFHPGFRCPITPGLTAQDCFVRFEKPEAPGGTDIFPLPPEVFDNDSICFERPESAWFRLEERGTGRYIQVDTAGFPFVLLWSQPGIPGFVCIEPWLGYPGPGHDLSKRPGARLLGPGESISATLKVTFEV